MPANQPPPRVARRNFVALNPLLKKGGVHEKTKSAKRQKAKRDLQKQVRAWRDFLSLAACLKYWLTACLSDNTRYRRPDFEPTAIPAF